MTNPRLQKLRQSNMDRRDALMAEHGAQLHPMTLMDAKLDAIIEKLDAHEQLEEQIAARFEGAEEQARLARLQHPLSLVPDGGLHLPNFGKDKQ